MQAEIHSDFVTLAHGMADAAGAILRKAYRRPVSVEQKKDLSPVTIADREVETALRALIESHYPEHGIIGEEFGNVRGESPWQWVLDPIDGTRSFIAGYPLFTTLIGLAFEGVPVLGIIDQPVLRERWLGMQGDKNLHHRTPGPQALNRAVIATTSIDYFTPDELQTFQRVKKLCANTILGGDAYAYAMLANGNIDIVIDAGLKPYDFCAIKPVIESLGGVITDWQGQPLTIQSAGRVVAAANAELHRQALTALQATA